MRRSGDRVRLEVEDDGPGIPHEERERVWQRFYRLLDGNQRVGSGLGLPIVRALAQAMDAEAWLGDGANGRGTCATVEFHAPARQLHDSFAS